MLSSNCLHRLIRDEPINADRLTLNEIHEPKSIDCYLPIGLAFVIYYERVGNNDTIKYLVI